jgi:hypothetical protein
VVARRVDGARELVGLTRSRLLATREDGQGRFFQFLGWSPRRYRTWALVVEVGDPTATLVLPEWHPTRPVSMPARLLPDGARQGVWLRLSADLSAPAPGRLCPASLSVCEPSAVPLSVVAAGRLA